MEDLAPQVARLVGNHTRNRRTVQQAMENNGWVNDMMGELSYMAQLQLVHLAHALMVVGREPTEDDHFGWPANGTNKYSTKATYMRLCQGQTQSPMGEIIWRSWVPLKCKM